MKGKFFIGMVIIVVLLFVSSCFQAQAETTGYLYYAGGGVPTTEDGNPALDGDLTGDLGVFSVLVADVYAGSGKVEDWRYATDASNKLAGHDDSAGFSWMFLENCVHVYNGYLYVGPGDWNVDSTRVTADLVAWAQINESNGTLGSWSYSDPIIDDGDDQAICATAIVDFGEGNAYYYVLGGTGGALSRVALAKINPDGSLGSWSSTTDLPNGYWFNRATAVGDTIIHGTGHQNPDDNRHIHYTTASPTDGAPRDLAGRRQL